MSTKHICIGFRQGLLLEGFMHLLQSSRRFGEIIAVSSKQEIDHFISIGMCTIVIVDVEFFSQHLAAMLPEISLFPLREQVMLLAAVKPIERAMLPSRLAGEADGFISTDHSFADALKAIEAAVQGGFYVPSHLLEPAGDYSGRVEHLLSLREISVLKQIGDGLTSKEVAERLHISVSTVESHRKHLMKKTDSRSLAELLRFGYRSGILTI